MDESTGASLVNVIVMVLVCVLLSAVPSLVRKVIVLTAIDGVKVLVFSYVTMRKAA